METATCGNSARGSGRSVRRWLGATLVPYEAGSVQCAALQGEVRPDRGPALGLTSNLGGSA
jgi:hypothetical protein